MKKLLLGLVIGIIAVFVLQYFFKKEKDESVLTENSALIAQEIKNGSYRRLFLGGHDLPRC